MRRPHAYLGLLLAGAVSAPLVAQSEGYSTDPFRDLPATSPRRDAAQPPRLAFVLEAEIPVPGPLPGEAPAWLGDRVVLRVAGGSVVTSPTVGATPEFTAAPVSHPTPAPEDAWVENETGKLRYRAAPDGTVQAQRRCRRCKKGWKRHWKLRVPGSSLASPLVYDGRVYFGALDNRLYCVKARNGHLVWARDLGARLSSRLVLWHGPPPSPPSDQPADEVDFILVLPDGGADLVVVSTDAGQEVAAVRLPDGDGKFVPGPLITPEGRVVVARQKYVAAEASLMVYLLRPIQPPPPEVETAATAALAPATSPLSADPPDAELSEPPAAAPPR